MSIQLFVATPLNYYKGWVRSETPEKHARVFKMQILSHFGIEITDTKDELYLVEDLSASAGGDIINTALEHSKEICKHLGGEVILPGSLEDKKIELPLINDKDVVYVDSTCNFKIAIDKIEQILKVKFKNFAKYGAEIDSYRRIIKVSEKEKMPIFWSY